MKIRFVKCMAVAFAMLVGSTAIAQDYYELSDTSVETVAYMGGGDDGKGCDDDCGKGGGCGYGKGILDGLGCCCGPTWYVDFDAMFLRYNRADGAQDIQNLAPPGTPNPGEYNGNFEFTPRLTLGMETANGTGLRIRWFDYSASKASPPPIAPVRTALVDTFNIDVEMFRNIDLACNTHMEWSIGVRYNDFKEQVTPIHPFFGAPYRNKFDGFGIVGGLEFTQDIRWGAIYGRCRGALLVDDREVQIGPVELAQNDVTVGMLELAVGWEASRCLNNGMVVTAGVGYEFQQWMNYGIATPLILPVSTPVDVGFDGVVFNFGVSY